MKAFIKFLLILILATASSGSIFGQEVRAVWMYDFDTWKTEANFGDRIYSASALGFNQIYLGVKSELLGQASYRDKMIEFVATANTLGIDVHATTLQNPHFTFDTEAYPQHDDALDRIQVILDYNADYPSAAFAGIHIDVEPHILTEANHVGHDHEFWTKISEGPNPVLTEVIKTRRAGIMAQFKTLVQRIRDEKIDPYNDDHPNVIFTSTVGWWYNERRLGAPDGYLNSGAAELTEYLDAIVPMVYSGGVGEDVDDIVSRVDDEIREANAPTIIGISHESLQNFPGGVQAAIAGLAQEFEGDPAFDGVAVFQFADLPTGTCPVPLFAQCGLDLNNSPIPGGIYQALPGAILTASGIVNSESNTPVVLRSSNAIELQPGFEVLPDMSVDFHAHIQAQCLPLLLETMTFEDNDYPDVQPEAYLYTGDFVEPLESNIPANGNGYVPGMSNRYFISLFGPRYKDVSSSNSNFYDFHTGEDMVDGFVMPESEGDPNENIICRCTGVVEEVDNVVGTNDEPGRWVKVRCNQEFRKNGQGPDWGNIFMAYRHLLSIANNPATGQMWAVGNAIAKGDIIGKMGASGVTVNNHLHYSIQRKVCDLGNTSISKGAYINVHALRTFDPAAYPHLLEPLDGAEIRLLDYSENTALLRIALPYNQFAVRAIRVSLPDGSYSREVDFEKISAEADDETQLRDDPEFTQDLRLFPYPYNHGKSAYERFTAELNDSPGFPAGYPGLTYPIPDEGIFSTPAYVLDIRAENLPDGFCLNDLRVSVIDIWGNGVKTVGNHPPQVALSLKDPNASQPQTRYLADDYPYFKNMDAEPIQFEASTFDLESSVGSVSLFVNGAFYGSDASAPFVFSVPASTLNVNTVNEFKAVAYDVDEEVGRDTSDILHAYVTNHQLFTKRIISTNDDAEENKVSHDVDNDSYDMDLCFDAGATRQFVGLRFTSVSIPPNAVIEKAFLQFTAKVAACGATDIHIYGQDADDAPTFVEGTNNQNISARPPTDATADWSLSAGFGDCWKLGASNLAQRSPDLSNIVQEIVQRPVWASGNDLVLVLENDDTENRRQAYSYSGCGLFESEGRRMSPKLIVEYSPPPASKAINTSLTADQGKVKIYPNPTAGNELFIEIKGMQSENAEIMLSNLTGQVLFAQAMLPIEGSRFKLDVSFLKPGAYFVQVKTENQTSVAKFIRQ